MSNFVQYFPTDFLVILQVPCMQKKSFLRLENIGIPQTRFTIGFSGTATDGFH